MLSTHPCGSSLLSDRPHASTTKPERPYMANDDFPRTNFNDLRPTTTPIEVDKTPALKLFVIGFKPLERQLLDGTVRLSQRRTPRLEQVPDDQARNADVVMIDALDPHAMRWAAANDWLKRRVVIWVDRAEVQHGHMTVRRPVQWPVLPMMLARALEQGARHAVPSAEPSMAAAPGQGSARLATVGGRTPVLVVDDSLAVRAHLRALLEPRGFTVTEAESAEAGIRAAATARFACILMDVLMPGMDGYEACRRIKSGARSGARPAVLMLTSKSSPFDRIRGKMAGCDAYLTKPVNPSDLHDVLLRHAIAAPAGAAGSNSGSSTAAAPLTPAPAGMPEQPHVTYAGGWR